MPLSITRWVLPGEASVFAETKDVTDHERKLHRLWVIRHLGLCR
jgi:hypothetical protein